MPPDLAASFFIALIPLFILAAGQSIVMIGGGVDLAAPGIMTLAIAVGSWVLSATAGSVTAAAVAMLAVGLALGLLTGLGVARLPLPAWMVSLAGLSVYGGLVHPPAPPPEGSGTPDMSLLAGPLPAWATLAVLVGIVLHLAMEKLIFGRWLRAIGCHRESARLAGVPVGPVTVGAYGLSGLSAGLAAVFLAAHPAIGGASPSPGWLVDILGAVVLGAGHRRGRRFPVGGVLLGALGMVGLGMLLAKAGASPGAILALKSLLVLAVLTATSKGDPSSDPG
jgi:ribose/xylose/arabinose/galactoside ABC-type transport system permease subunit